MPFRKMVKIEFFSKKKEEIGMSTLPSRIMTKIEQSERLLIFLSKNYLACEKAMLSLEYAILIHKPLIIVFIDERYLIMLKEKFPTANVLKVLKVPSFHQVDIENVLEMELNK